LAASLEVGVVACCSLDSRDFRRANAGSIVVGSLLISCGLFPAESLEEEVDDDDDDDEEELDFSLRCDELEECLDRSLDFTSRDDEDLDEDSGCLLLRDGFCGVSTTGVSTGAGSGGGG
jgi:hypothetical protein